MSDPVVRIEYYTDPVDLLDKETELIELGVRQWGVYLNLDNIWVLSYPWRDEE